MEPHARRRAVLPRDRRGTNASAIRDDPDAAPIVDADWFASANFVVPQPKEQISIRLDREVLQHFRQYPRYQTRINAILRAAMEHEKKTKAG